MGEEDKIMISLPIGLVMRIADLLTDIVKMKQPGYVIYETANKLIIDLTYYIRADLDSKNSKNLNAKTDTPR